MAGLQCLRRLWLIVHEPQPYEEPPAGSPLAVGYEIGRHAHKLFPGGVLVAEEPWQHEEAVARTAMLMRDPAVPAIFEAAFTHDDIRVRVDVLERLPDGWGLREVKSSTRVKDHYLDDVALQLHVLEGAGVAVRSAEVLHVDNTYIRGTGEVAWPEFFARQDVGELVAGAPRGSAGQAPGHAGLPAAGGGAGGRAERTLPLRPTAAISGGTARRISRATGSPCCRA